MLTSIAALGSAAALYLASSTSAATVLDYSANATQVEQLLNSRSYDYVVVGGGTSGLAVAARLSQSSKNYKVVVLEAGQHDPTNTGILVPGLAGSTLGTEVDWSYATVPQEHADGRSVFTPRGKVLGGSSALNFLVYTRPNVADVDEWANLGNSGWNWNGLLSYFKKAEKFYTPGNNTQNVTPVYNASVHGDSGPIDSAYPPYLAPSFKGFFGALRKLGVKEARDLSEGDSNGVSYAPSTQHPGSETRATSTDYLLVAPNLDVITGVQVTGINWLGDKSTGGNVIATGVSFVPVGGSNSPVTLSVSREVVLSAGTIQTPQLLELSGVGDPAVLEPLGIKTVVALPGVGQNLQDHPAQVNIYKLKSTVDSLDKLSFDPSFMKQALAQYAQGQGILTETLFPLAYLKLTDFLSKSDLSKLASLGSKDLNPQLSHSQWSASQNLYNANVNVLELLGINVYFGNATAAPNTTYISLAGCLQHALSRGSVHIKSANATAAPLIDPAYLQSPLDLFLLAKSAQFLRKVASQPALAQFIDSETEPGPAVQTDAQFEEWIRSVVRTEYHPVGTAAMLPVSDGGVVDPYLSVYGTQNVRVVDLSIVPIHVASHTQSVAYAIAEKAADMILDW